MYKIYKLYFEDDKNTCYIGRTKNIELRYNQHITNQECINSAKNVWLNSNVEKGKLPVIDVICECETLEEAKKLEVEYMNTYRDAVYDLKNTIHHLGRAKKKAPKAPRTEEQKQEHKNNIRKTREANNYSVGKRYKVTSPEGKEYTVNNLVRFCKEQGLNPSHMSKVARKVPMHLQHKGWIAEVIK